MSSIPLFPLNLVLFPGGPLPLRIFETRYLDMVGRCMREGGEFGVALIREGQEAGPAETVEIGTIAKIVDFHQLADGLLGLSCTGTRRFRITARSRQADGLNLVEVVWLPDEPSIPVPEPHARLARLLETVLPQLGEAYETMPMDFGNAAWVGHRLAEILPMPLADKQVLLELDDPVERLERLGAVVKPTEH